MKKFWIAACLIIMMPALTRAQTAQDSRRVEEEKLQILDEAPSREVGQVDRFSFETGGWINYRMTQYRDLDNDQSTQDSLQVVSSQDLRVWGKVAYQTPEMAEENRQHLIYLRLKNIYTRYSGPNPGERFDNRGPHLDYAYTTLDWRPWKVDAGRKYFNVGRGIAFGGVHDGVQINYQTPGWNFGLFAAQTLPHQSNIDTSVPGYDKNSRRYFGGLGVGYAGIKGHQLYGYTVVERDRSRERPEDVLQDYRYDAEYFSLGSKGEWRPQWPYWLEGILSTGKSMEDGTSAASDVRSWAFLAEQKYQTRWRNGLTLSAEYAMGSGDNDRLSVTDTISGNFTGNDRNFLYFGYIPTGIALAPRLSNLRMVRAGLDVLPFFFEKHLKKFSVGVDYFRYWKDQVEGGVYDADAAEDARELGDEVDVRIDWQINAHLNGSAEWGRFFPGKAYAASKSDNSDVFSFSLTYIF